MSGHHHSHALTAGPAVARWLRVIVTIVGIATLAGLAVYWPRGPAPDLSASTSGLDYVDAVVRSNTTTDCFDPGEALPTECQSVEVTISSGVTEGDDATVLISAIDFSAPTLAVGDQVVLLYSRLAPPEFQYVFVEYQRQTPLFWLGVLFVVVVIGFGRWKGVAALAGLAVSVGTIFVFLLPALLRGNNTVGVALVATSVVAFAALYIAHGVNYSTTVALVGTLGAVLLITLMALAVTGLAHLSGLSDESFQVLRVTADAIDPRGLLIAGIVIGALGVLDDVTVTQVAAVNELRMADPTMPRVDVYRAAVRIGRDHVASTVNTLVLAYAGASIALLLFFLQEGRSVTQVLNREVVAIEIARTLIGSIGLIIAVPVTTALAAATADMGNATGRVPGDSQGRGTRETKPDRARGPDQVPPSWDDFAPRQVPDE